MSMQAELTMNPITAGPMDILGIGRFSVITDLVGATVAMFTGQSECLDGSCGSS